MRNPCYCFDVLRRLFTADRARGLLAIIDQMMVSGTSFITVALLGRIGGAESLGIFTIAMSAIVIIGTALRSLIVTPYTVFAPRSHADERQLMRGATIAYYGLLASAITLVIVAGSAVYQIFLGYSQGNSTVWFGCIVAVILPSWVLRDLARRMSFADLKFGQALAIDFVQSVLQLLLIGMVAALGELTAGTALIAVAVAAAISAASVAPGIGWLVAVRKSVKFRQSTFRSHWNRTWRFGRWGAISQFSHVVQGYVLSWIIAVTGGLTSTGSYAAMWSIISLASPFAQGAGNALGPMLAKRFADKGIESVIRAVRGFTAYTIAPVICFPLFIYLLGPLAVTLIYGNKYDPSAITMAMLAASVSVSVSQLIATKVISILEFPHVNVVLNVMTLIVTTILASVMGAVGGISGAAAGLMIASMIGAGAKWLAFAAIVKRF